eukprot:TRINITY_DN9992_c0_g1_i8.p2 TRINITY_DN9992_c0_g1~~TRINITY_DN9992_c0_g1_i8.p2  ORF type:complete len:156 (+),score=37.59 TRINITY_DN9992_c0_g1_i8:38-469(+)
MCIRDRSQDEDRRPSFVPKELWCNACQAISREALKVLRHRTSEVDIAEALNRICFQNMAVYEFPPPDMTRGCDAFIAGWDEELESALVRRKNNEDFENDFCYKQTKACEGADFSKVSKNDNYVNVNGKQVPVGPDGAIKMDEL